MADGSDLNTVLIIGAGPVGLFTALLLARANIRSQIFEKTTQLQSDPRAAGHYGPDLEVMKKAGVYDIFAREANFQDGLVFRAPPVDNGEGGKTHGRDIAVIRDLQLTLPQSTMVKLLEKEIMTTGMVVIHYGRELVGIEQDDHLVTISAKDIRSGEVKFAKGKWLVGTDGGRSAVRSLLGISFPGHTWKERLIATDVTRTNDDLAPIGSHLVVHPTKWGVVIPLTTARLGEESLWRYAIAVHDQDTRLDEELLKDDNILASYESLMVGKRPIVCEIKKKSVYHIHQRLAATMRKGRCLLAGDAAHLCNPLGGMGLTTGILDAEAVADALIMVINEGCSDRVLWLYSDLRRQVFGYFVDPMSTQNKYRVQSSADDLEIEDGFTSSCCAINKLSCV
ncbi:FAD-binding monooxygenase [Leptodontidium sp. MPI-SDFR-AT-0119]|nr:FAD-binding monooxygenase [Leptodontidium sp. MPI-SDFR-AT-0119]